MQNNPYLGLQISDDFKWTTHVTNVTKKANSTFGFVRRNLNHCPEDCKKTAYISLVRSTMEYGAIVWDPYTIVDTNKVKRIQRRAAKFITGDNKSRKEGFVTKMLAELELESLQSRRTSQRLIFMYKVVEGLAPAIKPEDYLTINRQGRTIKHKRFDDYVNTNIVENSVKNNTKSFDRIQGNTEQYRNSFFSKTILEWNHLEENIVSATSVESFKYALRHHQYVLSLPLN